MIRVAFFTTPKKDPENTQALYFPSPLKRPHLHGERESCACVYRTCRDEDEDEDGLSCASESQAGLLERE